MRLIDADEAIINFGFEWDDIPPTIEEFVRFLKKQPTVNAAEVVRCRDCKHRIYVDMGDEIGAVGGCELFGLAMHYDCFCSYGEQKDGDWNG